MNNFPLNFYKRMQSAFTRVANRAPQYVEEHVIYLGDLIADFAPYVGTGQGVDDNDISQIKENDTAFYALDKLQSSAHNGVLKQNLIMVFHMARNSLNKTDETGDKILVEIAKTCGVIATILNDKI